MAVGFLSSPSDDVPARGGLIPDGPGTPPPAAPLAGSISTDDETLPSHLCNIGDAAATSSGMPVSNPFEDVAKSAPLEADLHDLAAQDHGVHLTEMHRVHVGTPTPLLLTTRTGLQEQEEQLAHIGMAVRITRTVKATEVPVGGASATAMESSPTQTITIHREANGVIVGILDSLQSDEPPEEPEGDDLHEINTEFVGDLLRDGRAKPLPSW